MLAQRSPFSADPAVTTDNFMPTVKPVKGIRNTTAFPSRSAGFSLPLFSPWVMDLNSAKPAATGPLPQQWPGKAHFSCYPSFKNGLLWGQCATGLWRAHLQNRPPNEASVSSKKERLPRQSGTRNNGEVRATSVRAQKPGGLGRAGVGGEERFPDPGPGLGQFRTCHGRAQPGRPGSHSLNLVLTV